MQVRPRIPRTLPLCLALLLCIDIAIAQEAGIAREAGVARESGVAPARSRADGFWPALRRTVLPRELSLVYDLRAFIAEQPPLHPRSREGDLARLDVIYRRAVYLAEGDGSRALLALAFATLPYHTFPARIPLLGFGVTVPVSTESEASFARRMASLPGLLFPDSPPQLDRDKLPHFFGSAGLQVALRNEEITALAGELLETGEELFKLEGFRDERDLMVNRLGACFGLALQRHRRVLPSDLFRQVINTLPFEN